MIYHWLANLVVLIHLGFVLFVVLGALLLLRWPGMAWLHLPAALWGGLIELAGWVCPLTPLENYFRRLAGDAGYQGGFIEHYVTALIYPAGLSRGIQIGLGLGVILLNSILYWQVWRRHRLR
jgi:Protein of Unknown function (DUF2784)